MNRFRSIVMAAVFAGVSVSAASAQTISVVSGNGQVLSVGNSTLRPLVVEVTDANDNPLSNQTVNWNAPNYLGSIPLFLGSNQTTSVTDATGQTTVFPFFATGTFPSFVPFTQVTVTAALSSGSSVTFTETSLQPAPNSTAQAEVTASLTNPQGAVTTFPGDNFSGAVGTVDSRTIQINVVATNGIGQQAIPNAAVQLLNYQDPAAGPAVACVSSAPAQSGFGTVLTDANGNATCTVAFGGRPGNGQFDITVGGVPSATVIPPNFGFWQTSPNAATNPTPLTVTWHTFIPLEETVISGSAGSIKITQGNGQTASPGQSIATPLQVEVDSTAGQPLSGVTVNWKVSPPNAAVLGTPTGSTDFTGRTSTTVTLAGGSLGNTVQVTATVGASSLSQTFTIAVNQPVSVTAFNIVSGNNQSAPVNTAFAQPLVVGLTASAGSPAGFTVQFTASGPVSLSATTATTDSNGHAPVNVSAGSVAGSANVTATVTGAGSQTFSLVVTPPAPTITAGNFANGADLQANSLSPCGLGALVAPAGTLGVTGVGPAFPGLQVPNSNVSITFSNIPAPIVNVGTTAGGQQQITFQVPCSVTPSTSVPVTVGVGSGSTPVNVAVGAVSPGIFQTQMSDGTFRAVLVRPDGSYVSLQNPARRGETEIAFVTGLGATSPAVGTEALPVPGTTATVLGNVVPGMEGQAVPLMYARLSEDLPGVYLVAFQIPASMTTGNNVTFSIGIQASGATTTAYSGLSTIPVQ